MGNQDPLLPTAEAMNKEKLSPQPADSILMQTEGSLVTPSEQAPLGQQAHDQNEEEVSSAQQKHELESQQESIPHVHPDNDSAVQHLTEDEDDHGDGVNDHDESTFSDYGSEYSSSFYTSILSEATDYYWENGRRYHAHQGGRYLLPNDEVELDREDMKHHEWMLITDFRLHLSPIGNNPQRILDIGTGTDKKLILVADRYPSAQVIGTDISPIQPTWVPSNLTFEVDDLEAEWLYRPGTYDLVHVRFMFLAIKDYPAMLAQAYRTLKPGGYVELSELGVTPEATNQNYPPPFQIFRWLDLYDEAMKKMGFNFRVAHAFKNMLTEAGFVDVVETKFEVPWGAWPKDRRRKAIGLWHLEQLKQGLQGIVMGLFTRSLGWTPSEVEVFLVELRKQLDDMSYQLLDHAYVVYGRKP
ncbi:S-adenosyl-L-methionine-dependent methyltransferase [Lepidopterella palustris CBS 459.81]|uniref:S-adenosyl-L-methionine-dependent methyltransferase n=1 Tax=Lepidopterella palustris CBS 459.81 TaxID=1314670 RepID=A0A8E2DWJ8_9PEZI|nr:S-adenosyl-L-methionine-dependent methyltransferase [Lepidopterella palustris CBS 459.81]